MGLHRESVLAKCTTLEAELRRRLWWSLIIFDTRVSEMADSKTATLTPTWDCRIPLNVNDSDLRLDMKEPPQLQGKITEALFAVVRSELGDFVRHTMFHLIFSGPALKSAAKNVQHGPSGEGCGLDNIEERIEDEYLRLCDSENPLHFMTIWMTRAYLAKCRLVEHHFIYPSSFVHQAEEQRNAATSYALTMLECDTKIMTAPHVKGFLWLIDLYFPFTAYLQVVQSLKWRPLSEQADKAWEIMSENFEARFCFISIADNPFFQMFAKIVLQAWDAHEAAIRKSGESLVIPKIILSIKRKAAQAVPYLSDSNKGRPDGASDMGDNNFPMPTIPIGSGNYSLYDSMGGQSGSSVIGPASYPNMLEPDPLDLDGNQFDWYAMDWDLLNTPVGEAGGSTGLSLPD